MMTFGTEATIENLVEVSKYTNEQVWLFSVELFCKEVKKFNMKLHAESKESEAELELIKQKEEAKNKNK